MFLGNQQQFGDVKKQTWRCNKPTPQWGLVCGKTFLETGNHDSIRDLAKNIKEQWWFGEVFDHQKMGEQSWMNKGFGEDPEFLLDDFAAILWRSLFLIFCEAPPLLPQTQNVHTCSHINIFVLLILARWEAGYPHIFLSCDLWPLHI